MTQSRSLSDKFPSYRQEACTTENVIQCLSIRERKKERVWVEGRIYKKRKNKTKQKLEDKHFQRTKEDHIKGEKSGYI